MLTKKLICIENIDHGLQKVVGEQTSLLVFGISQKAYPLECGHIAPCFDFPERSLYGTWLSLRWLDHEDAKYLKEVPEVEETCQTQT